MRLEGKALLLRLDLCQHPAPAGLHGRLAKRPRHWRTIQQQNAAMLPDGIEHLHLVLQPDQWH